MGTCLYRFNPSEIYQRTHPGMGVETSCGALTFPAVDEPELAPVRLRDGSVEYRPTGRLVPREQDDPHCPAHGGCSEPDPPPVDQAELEDALERYHQLAELYARQQGIEALPADLQLPAGTEVTADQVSAAAHDYVTAAAAAAAAHLSGGTDGPQ